MFLVGSNSTSTSTMTQGPQHFKQTKIPDISPNLSMMNFQNSRIIILTYLQFDTICHAIAENHSVVMMVKLKTL